MPTADQIKALLTSHAEGDSAHFYSIAMQIAASEARQGNGKVAEELRALIDKSKARTAVPSAPIPLNRPRGELADILSVSYPKTKVSDMVLTELTEGKLGRVIREHRSVRPIRSHGLAPRRKLLLVGPPGTGKTLTASALAGELGLPLFVVHLDGLITKFMGETAAKLRLIFEAIAQTRAVYLFDEFDSIGAERGLANDVGEIRRVVSSFLQMVEQDHSDSLIIAATNHIALLDRALFRRFDDIIRFELPNASRAKLLLQAKLAAFKPGKINWTVAAKSAAGLSYADVARAAEDAIKDVLISGREAVSQGDLVSALKERRATLRKKGADD
ncbi:ATP-binding protein [Bradyrhizobium sp. LMTR 3]|uniref:AAA family ATPase n=1 Tax=Bradyrhizobium sp. LMTR 3 TaxID=189873 RepID=UPI000810F1E7|nr:ATP-binding protein [Bradyrhizobium sp. LMTR 3]OCK55439.1 ATPase [Bradyrhizobium sp. LMTR 3]